MHAPPGFHGPFRTDDAARALYAEGAGIFRIIPAAVACPASIDDLVALVRWAGDTGTPLVPRGAGSGMPGGNVGPGVVVDLTRGFRDTPIIDPEARLAMAAAGATWKALDDAASLHGLRLPVNPSSGRFCTLGGMVAANAAGAHSYRYGAMRDWVESIDFVTADGETGRATRLDPARTAYTAAERRLLRDVAPVMRQHQLPLEHAAPRVRKNSSGYVLTNYPDSGWVRHLLIGSEGTLALVTGVEVRLMARPRAAASMMLVLRSLDELQGAVTDLGPHEPAAVELLDRTYLEFVRALGAQLPADTQAVLLVEFEDDAIEAARAAYADATWAEDEATSHELWALRHRASPILAALPDTTRSLQVVEDGCVPLNRLGDYINGLRHIARTAGFEIVIFGHAGDAHVHANLLADVTRADLADALERCLREASALQLALGGTVSGEHGDGRLRAPFVERLFGAPYFDVCRRVKAAFDPKGILNPGVKLTVDGSSQTVADLFAHHLKVGRAAPALPGGIAGVLRDIERKARWDEDRLTLLDAENAASV